MSYDEEDRFKKALAGRSHFSRPKPKSTGNFQLEKEAKLSWSVDQATARGLIDPEEAEAAKTNNDRTWWDKMLGFEESSRNMFGPVPQAAIDVLSLGNYASAAMSQATIKDPLVTLGGLKIGATPSAWLKEWKKRPYYTDQTESFGEGLLFDIAADPITYLTFGVGAGIKIGVKGGVKIGAKTVPQGVKALHLTRYGDKIYKQAARDLAPRIEKFMAEEVSKVVDQGRKAGYLDHGMKKLAVHDMIGKHMIENHARLAGMANAAESRFKKLIASPTRASKTQLERMAEEGTKKHWAHQGAEDMFRETAGVAGRDIGTSFKTINKRLAALPVVGDSLRAIAPNFSRSYGVPDDILDVWHLTQGAVKAQVKEANDLTRQTFRGLALSEDEMRLAISVAESGDIGMRANARHIHGRVIDDLAEEGSSIIGDNVKEAAKYAREQFDTILKAEHEAGFKINSVEDYVYRVFSTKAARTLRLEHIGASAATSNHTSKAGFQMHRTIATFEDAIEEFGKGMVETNLATIVMKRQSASVKMREMDKFYDYLKATSGITPMLVAKIGNESTNVARLLKKIFQSQSPEDARMIEFDQLYGAEEALHKRLGFVMDPKVYSAGGRIKNLDMLDYLGLDEGARFAQEGASLTGKVRPNEFAQTSSKLQRTGKFGVGKEMDVPTMIRAAFTGGTDFIDQAALVYGIERGAVTHGQVRGTLIGMDNWARKELGAPLLHIFPDIVKVFERQAVKKGGKRFSKVVKGDNVIKVGFERYLAKVEKEMKRAFGKGGRGTKDHTRTGLAAAKKLHVAQLPVEIVNRAKFMRFRYGDYTDIMQPTESVIKEMFRLKKKLGMKGENLSEVAEALVGKKSISELTAREADQLVEFLGVHADEAGKTIGAKSGNLFGTVVRKVDFGTTTQPAFKKVASEVGESREAIERFTAEAAEKIMKTGKYEQKAMALRKLISDGETALEGMRSALVPGLDGVTAAKLADQIKNLDSQIKNYHNEIDALSQILNTVPDKNALPKLADDVRQFIGMDEVIKRNGDVLDSASKSLGRRAGVQRVKAQGFRAIVPAEEMKAVTEARGIMKAETKKAQREIAKITKQFKALGEGELTPVIQKEFDDLFATQNKIIADAISTAKGKFVSKVRILSGGRYLDPTGKVRDIVVMSTGGTKGKKIVGKYADEIRKALSRDAMSVGRQNVEYLEPAVRTTLPDTIIGQSAGTYYLPKQVADFLDDIVTPLYAGKNTMVDNMLKKFDRVMNLYKVPLLAPWGSSMARNALGNVSLAYLKAGLSLFKPSYLSDYMKGMMYVWAKESPAFRAVYMGTKEMTPAVTAKIEALGNRLIKREQGAAVKVSEVVDNFSRRGVMTGFMRDEVFDIAARGTKFEKAQGGLAGAAIGGSLGGPIGAGIGAALGGMAGKETYIMRNLFKFQEMASELPTRMMLGMHTFKQGGSFDDVGRTVRHWLHDYSALSTFERRTVRRIIPFYNFTKLAVRTAASSVIDHPGRVLQPYKIFNSQNTNPLFNDRAMPEDVPDWFHHQMVFMSRDFDPDTGEVKTSVTSGFNLPIQEVLNLADIIGPGGQSITHMAARGPFGAKSVMEYMFNYDTFKSGPIYPDAAAGIKTTQFQSGKSFEASPEWMKTLVGYRVGDDGKPVVNPRVRWALGQIPTSRFINASKKVWELDAEGAKKFNYWNAAANLVGISRYRFDPETGKYYENQARIHAMENVLANIQVLKSRSLTSTTFDKPSKRKKKKLPEPFPGY